MRITVFDTETISTNKPFVYNIGYLIYDTETDKTLLKKDFVVKEIWQNKELFEKFHDCWSEYISLSEAAIFEYAFKLGANLMLNTVKD